MTREDFIKQAYAYGASVALQELGYAPQDAEAGAIKLAQEQPMEKLALSGAEAKAALERLMASIKGGAGRAGGEAQNLLEALKGGFPYPKAPVFTPERLTTTARQGLGAGLAGGAGLGAGGMALGNALSD